MSPLMALALVVFLLGVPTGVYRMALRDQTRGWAGRAVPGQVGVWAWLGLLVGELISLWGMGLLGMLVLAFASRRVSATMMGLGFCGLLGLSVGQRVFGAALALVRRAPTLALMLRRAAAWSVLLLLLWIPISAMLHVWSSRLSFILVAAVPPLLAVVQSQMMVRVSRALGLLTVQPRPGTSA